MNAKHAAIGAVTMLAWAIAPASAFADVYSIDTSSVNLTIDVQRRPIFPVALQQQGYTEGKVIIAFEIDHTGELRDWLPIESSHPAFVQSIARVIDSWDFSPPLINGESQSIVSRLTIDYRSTGNVLSFDLASGLSSVRFNELIGWSEHHSRLAKVRELDTPPRPIKQVAPTVPTDVIARYGGTTAIFSFYVDETGAVRIPSLRQINGDAEPGMLLAAQEALEQWRFEPPTSRSKPVSIRLSQSFVFAKE